MVECSIVKFGQEEPSRAMIGCNRVNTAKYSDGRM